MKLTLEAYKEIVWEDLDEESQYQIVETTEWTQDHKYQTRDVIFKDKETGKFYEIYESRSGSYHSDWFYDHEYWKTDNDVPTPVEVKKKEVTITKWVRA